MPIFKCDKCGCVENTACCYYWHREYKNGEFVGPALCSECDPRINRWHNRFPKQSAKGFGLGDDGFLYESGYKSKHVRIIKVIE